MELLDSRQLRAFQELARRGSFTLAARQLNLTQSAVSHSIKALESTLGTELFERSGKSVHLTNSGEILLPHVDRILNRMRIAQDEIASARTPGFGRLRIGSSIALSQYVLPSVIREVRESFPSFEISVTTEDSRQLADLLTAGEVDLIYGLETRMPAGYEFSPLFDDHIALAMAPAHPLAEKPRIEPTDLAAQQFIYYHQNSETFRLVDRWFADAKVSLRAPLQMGSMAAIKEMAKIGIGIGLIPPWVAETELRAGALVLRDLPVRQLGRRWGVYRDSQHAEVMIETVFTGIFKSVIDTLQVRTSQYLEVDHEPKKTGPTPKSRP